MTTAFSTCIRVGTRISRSILHIEAFPCMQTDSEWWCISANNYITIYDRGYYFFVKEFESYCHTNIVLQLYDSKVFLHFLSQVRRFDIFQGSLFTLEKSFSHFSQLPSYLYENSIVFRVWGVLFLCLGYFEPRVYVLRVSTGIAMILWDKGGCPRCQWTELMSLVLGILLPHSFAGAGVDIGVIYAAQLSPCFFNAKYSPLSVGWYWFSYPCIYAQYAGLSMALCPGHCTSYYIREKLCVSSIQAPEVCTVYGSLCKSVWEIFFFFFFFFQMLNCTPLFRLVLPASVHHAPEASEAVKSLRSIWVQDRTKIRSIVFDKRFNFFHDFHVCLSTIFSFFYIRNVLACILSCLEE